MTKQSDLKNLQSRISELEEQAAVLDRENLALRQNEEQFRALFEKAADYIFLFWNR